MRTKLKSIVFFLIICVSAVQGQIVFQSGFENTFTTDWDTSSAGNTMLTYEINSESKRQGSKGFHMKFNDASQKGNLVTPKNIEWKEGVSYTISFYYKAVELGTNNEPNIKIFNSSGTKIGHINIMLNSASWTQYSTTFTADENSIGGYVLFSIRPNDNGSGEFYFDDFLIEEIVPETGFFVDIKSKDITSDETIKWVQFGPGMSGNNTSFFVHPTDENVVYSSPNMGNSYRSTDKGFTYETILNEDAASYRSGERGPIETYSMDFSRSNDNLGFTTGKLRGDLFKTTNKGKTWARVSSIQSQGGDAYLACVAADPTNDAVWYLGAGRMRDYGRIEFPQSQPHGDHIDANSQGKIWKTTNGGSSWTLVNNGINSNAEVETILVDPIDANIVYAGTNYGFYKSIDGGANWVLKQNGMNHNVIRSFTLYHNPSLTGDDVVLYVVNNITWKADGNTVTNDKGGVFKSTDKGETWVNITNNLVLNLTSFSGNKGIKESYYNTIEFYFGLSSREEAESTYSDLPTAITQRFNTISVDPNDANNLYLINNYSNASDNNFKPGQIWRSKDGGANWYVTFRNGENWNNGNDDAFWTGRDNPLGTNLTFKYKSDWLNRDDYERKGCNFVKFNADGSVLFTQLAKIGFVSYDKGDTWVDIDDEEANESGSNLKGWVGAGNSNVPGHGFYQSALWPEKVFCPSGENSLWITNNQGEAVRSGAQGASVMQLVFNNSGVRLEHSVSSVAVHPTDKNTWFATFFRQAGRGELYKTTDAGANWQSVGTPIPEPWDPAPAGSGDQAVHQLSLQIDKNNPDNMYFCVPKSSIDLEWVGDSAQSWGVHRSIDGGVTWEEVNNGLPSSLDVARLKIDPTDTNTLYATVIDANGGLYKSTDKGNNWTQVASTTSISGTSGINDIHFDGNGKVYITSGYKNVDQNEGGLWVSDDDMISWTKIFDYPWTNRVEVAKYDPNTIMVSTLPNTKVNLRNAGTYLSKDGGVTWIKFNKGNGQADRVNDIAIDYSVPGKYYASTRGSGWYMALDPNPNATILSIDNINIKSFSESCADSNNGKIEITANQNLEYTAVLNGDGINNSTKIFTNTTLFDGIASGSYDLCITPKGGDDLCYVVSISEPKNLQVATTINQQEKTMILDLKGGKTYKIQLNNQQIVTSENQIELMLKAGVNNVTVTTDIDCQGEFEKEVFVDGLTVSPNPTNGVVVVKELKLGDLVKVYNVQGALLMHTNKAEKFVDLSNLKNGIYVLSVQNKEAIFTKRIIKK
ncbi:photosystem II stability/assembly factor-like uncharacterized protein [Wenyingzhuangia heitensis]|uniref:Photosystem II stability/assembly factor-like uncharacterized protein n=1 Tax=Wenyingzhuangia heitensis TaxID=1487859 RepID=A0ABX0UDE3_9FLAO|nr:T9SS type A sorting domain-containing protein [Wenyingzhuangia heitensis]NIJ45905.1 photosystem II stability/assembly factor-like uncharacterized protein [Wenyingzhuangia heitensis]